MALKYQPLAAYLAQQPAERVTLTFAEVEAIIGAPLPAGAQRASWWADTQTRSAQTRAWLRAGWWVLALNLGTQTVAFSRRPPTDSAG